MGAATTHPPAGSDGEPAADPLAPWSAFVVRQEEGDDPGEPDSAQDPGEPDSAQETGAAPPPDPGLDAILAEEAAGGEPARAPAPTSPDAANLDAAPSSEGGGIPVHGSLFVRYRGRRTGDADDHDLWTTVALDVGDPDEHAVTGHFMGRLWADLGGSDSNDVFFGLDDTFGSVHGIVYYAYVDAEQIDSLETLRVGRQQIWETPAFLVFDGVRLETNEISGITFGAYGGLRTQYYDTSRPDDVVAGLYGEGSPWDGGRVRVDYMYLEDDQRLGSNANDLVGLDVRHQVGDELTLEGEFTALDGNGRDLRLRAHYLDPEEELTLQVTYYTLLQTQKQQALEIDPYFSSLLEYDPFHQVGILASKGLGDDLVANVGVDVRRLDDSSDEGVFNHEFERYYLSTVFQDLGLDGLDLTLIGDVWSDDQQDVRTWGVDVTHRFDEQFRGSLGSYYSLYKYDLFLSSERDDVRTYYGRLQYAHTDALIFHAELEHEDDDFERYQRLRLGMRWQF